MRQSTVESAATQEGGNNLCLQEHMEGWAQRCEARDSHYHYIHSKGEKRTP